MSNPRRGFLPKDEMEFNKEKLTLLRRAQQDILYLLEQGYPVKGASTFVGNHYMLSERQRLAVVRSTVESKMIALRRVKELDQKKLGEKVVIDGTIRDLAGLRGTYRLIEETNTAISFIGEHLAKLKIKEVLFYLDAPVSNTGRLKSLIYMLLERYPYKVSVELVNNPDIILESSENVISSDAIILNKCSSWYNLVADILQEKLPDISIVDLS